MEHSDPGLSMCGLRLLNLQTQILKPSLPRLTRARVPEDSKVGDP